MAEHPTMIPILIFKAKVMETLKGEIEVTFELDPRDGRRMDQQDVWGGDNGFDVYAYLKIEKGTFIHIDEFLEVPWYVGMRWENDTRYYTNPNFKRGIK